jgi:hypothetical protein
LGISSKELISQAASYLKYLIACVKVAVVKTCMGNLNIIGKELKYHVKHVERELT